MTKYYLKFMCVLAITGSAFLMTSCDKENIDTEVLENYVNQSVFEMQKQGNCGKFGCFEFVFPISIEFPNGTTVAVESYEELRTTVSDWKKDNADAEERPTLAFPLEVLSEDGTIISIADKTELRDLAKECRRGYFGSIGWKGHHGKHGGKGMGSHGDKCFDIIFPITINYPDETSGTYEDATALKEAVRAWKKDNRGSGERPAIAFPITVEFEDETTQLIESKDALRALKDMCSDGN